MILYQWGTYYQSMDAFYGRKGTICKFITTFKFQYKSRPSLFEHLPPLKRDKSYYIGLLYILNEMINNEATV